MRKPPRAVGFHFDLPAVFVDQRDDFGGDVQPVGQDSQEAVAVHAGRATAILAATLVRRDLHDHQSHGMIRLMGRFGAQADANDLIAEHIHLAISVGQRSLFRDLVNAVVA